ncbi:MAG TPA: Flp family type IVb pilin [Rhizobiaceae bacterium]|nr:Flp family type IVb pilin [Rhizobiaceae bacterium]
MLMRFWKDQRGVTMIEYGLIIGILSMAIISTISLTADQIKELFASPTSELNQSWQ